MVSRWCLVSICITMGTFHSKHDSTLSCGPLILKLFHILSVTMESCVDQQFMICSHRLKHLFVLRFAPCTCLCFRFVHCRAFLCRVHSLKHPNVGWVRFCRRKASTKFSYRTFKFSIFVQRNR